MDSWGTLHCYFAKYIRCSYPNNRFTLKASILNFSTTSCSSLFISSFHTLSSTSTHCYLPVPNPYNSPWTSSKNDLHLNTFPALTITPKSPYPLLSPSSSPIQWAPSKPYISTLPKYILHHTSQSNGKTSTKRAPASFVRLNILSYFFTLLPPATGGNHPPIPYPPPLSTLSYHSKYSHFSPTPRKSRRPPNQLLCSAQP